MYAYGLREFAAAIVASTGLDLQLVGIAAAADETNAEKVIAPVGPTRNLHLDLPIFAHDLSPKSALPGDDFAHEVTAERRIGNADEDLPIARLLELEEV